MDTTIKFMGLEILIGGLERKDGYISYVDKDDPDGVVKQSFTIISNDKSTFKEIDTRNQNFQFHVLERQLFGLLMKFVESGHRPNSAIIGYRFYQRPELGMSSIAITKHKNNRGSYELVIDFVRPILPPSKKHDKYPHANNKATTTQPVEVAPVIESESAPVRATGEALKNLADHINKPS